MMIDDPLVYNFFQDYLGMIFLFSTIFLISVLVAIIIGLKIVEKWIENEINLFGFMELAETPNKVKWFKKLNIFRGRRDSDEW